MSGSEERGGTRVTSLGGVPSAIEAHRYRLRVVQPDGEESLHLGGADPVEIGSHPGNDVVLDDETVSRIHLRLEPDEHGLCATDLDSTNGTRVDGYRVGRIYLRDNSTIELGRCRIELRFEGTREVRELSPDARFGPLVGGSPVMRKLYRDLETAAQTELPVLLEGETGCGKEVAARAVHEASLRAELPFVVFDCAAVSATLLESTLFGHERGAFTGATDRHIGLAEEAGGGTLFLDEIGELPLELQSKLLRMLEAREIRRVGGRETIPLEARIVAATNRDLSRGVNQGSFRADLYYRLAVVRLELPPLRSRREDIPLLVERFVRDSVRDPGRAREVLDAMSEEDWRRLEQHPWPGNVRELRNVVQRMVALGNDALGNDDSTDQTHDDSSPSAGDGVLPALRLDAPFVDQRKALLDAYERWYLKGLVAETKGNVSAAARIAGIDRMYFKRLLKKYE
ncbi:MAG: sigma 54-interacting transcriptional regulator [Sandaracinaceae bacterium]